jgi:hypothetical protein
MVPMLILVLDCAIPRPQKEAAALWALSASAASADDASDMALKSVVQTGRSAVDAHQVARQPPG